MVDAATRVRRAHAGAGPRGRRARRLVAGLTAAIALTAVAASCGSDDAADDDTSTEAPSAPDSSGASATAGEGGETPVDGGTLTYLQPFPTRGFDPASGTVNAQFGLQNFAIFDALVMVHSSDGRLELRLLEAADSTDGLKWTLKVRPGVTFSDGTPFDAEAIKFNWERLSDPATAAVGAAAAQAIDTITVVDDLTLEVVLAEPNGQLPYTIATNTLTWVGSPTAIRADPVGFNAKPVGAGAFTVEEWVPNTQTVLVKNPTYFDTVHLDKVVVKEITDEAQRLTTLQSGGGDMMRTINGISAQTATEAGFESLPTTPGGGFVVFFNMRRAPFDDVRARRAISLAMDAEALSDAVYNGFRTPADNILQESSPFYDASLALPAPDDAEAQALLDELADETGAPLKAALAFTPPFAAEAEWFQTKLGAFDNLEVTLDPVDSTDFQTRFAGGDVDFGMHSYQIGDPDSMTLFLGTGGSTNFSGLSDSELDQLLADGRASMDPERRTTIYAEVQRRIIDDVPFTFFLRQEAWEVYNGDVVHGATPEHQQTINGGAMLNELWVTR
jgi:peptide/nickel transport system substrate-binding protein